ncbi:MAG: flagellar motor protein MotA [Sphingobacteriales bacterium BACL12 MAG-120802-bin5]|jgi:biopolymer transport protein ExbB|nr:MAG: flagellar motor protein MotA [Sphingobacteriales bacterium BACL12 MAG-120802-bin5]
MKKLIAIVALLGILMVQTSNVVMAQDAAGTEEVVAEGEGGITLIKRYFIEGDYVFMSLPLLCLILGLAFCIERIITLSLADVNTKKLLTGVESAIGNKDVEKAKQICKATRGPVASIMYQGLTRTEEGIDIVEKSVASYGSVQMGQLEKGLSWISLFIALAPMLGFLGTVIGMVQAFDDIANAGAISATIVASGIKVALLTTVFGLIVAIILQIFYNFIVTKVESIVNKMEDNSISFIDILVKNKIV